MIGEKAMAVRGLEVCLSHISKLITDRINLRESEEKRRPNVLVLQP